MRKRRGRLREVKKDCDCAALLNVHTVSDWRRKRKRFGSILLIHTSLSGQAPVDCTDRSREPNSVAMEMVRQWWVFRWCLQFSSYIFGQTFNSYFFFLNHRLWNIPEPPMMPVNHGFRFILLLFNVMGQQHHYCCLVPPTHTHIYTDILFKNAASTCHWLLLTHFLHARCSFLRIHVVPRVYYHWPFQWALLDCAGIHRCVWAPLFQRSVYEADIWAVNFPEVPAHSHST